ncbi:MAG: MoaD/ThiS family protein [Bacillota bacterium]
MRVKVYLPPYLSREFVSEDGYLQLQEGATLKKLFELLKVPIPIAAVHLCRVNYEKATLNTRLNDGDIVSFFSLLSGG